MNKYLKWIYVLLSTVVVSYSLYATEVYATTYYIDCNAVNDSGAGTSAGTAWKTIARVNSGSFSPDDSVLFNKGCTWSEQLNIPSSGSSGHPITFASYGIGVNPIIKRSNTFNAWTAHSLIQDGSMEQYTLSGSANDNWGSFSEFNSSAASSVKVDTAVFHSGNASAKLSAMGDGIAFGAGNYAALTPYVSGIQNNTAYHLSVWGRTGVSGNNALVLRVVDTDNGKYLDSSGTWQSSNVTVAATWNGSPVDTWVKKDLSFISAATGSGNYQIKLYNFQTGSAWIDDWYMNTEANSSTKIWAGYERSAKMHL